MSAASQVTPGEFDQGDSTLPAIVPCQHGFEDPHRVWYSFDSLRGCHTFVRSESYWTCPGVTSATQSDGPASASSVASQETQP